jgi:hypothetical protein
VEHLQGPPWLRRQFKIYMPCFPTERPIADRLQGPLRPRRRSQLPPSRIGYPAAEMAQNPSLPPRHLKTLRLFLRSGTRQRGCHETSHGPVVSSRPYASFSDQVSGTGDGTEPATTASSTQDLYASFSDPVPSSGDVAEPATTASSAQDLYASFSDQVPGSGDGAAATTSSGEEPQLRLSDAVDQSNLTPTSSASAATPASLLNPHASTWAGLIQSAAYLGPAKQSWDGTIPPFVLAQNVANTPPHGGGEPPDKTEQPPPVGNQSDPSTGQKLVQSTVDLAPGAYYARLAAEQSHAGNYGTAAVYGTASLVDAAVGVGTFGLGARIESAVRNIVKAGAEVTSETVGGVYRLIDSETGEVMRTGRTNDLIRRGAEHGRDPVLKAYCFETVFRTDDYAELRGLEQYLHELHNPPLNRKNPIDPRNENRDQYIEAAKRYLERILGK